MKCLVVGYGSIGRRHSEVLIELGYEVAVVSSQSNVPLPCFSTVSDAAKWLAEYIVIASPTDRHAVDFQQAEQLPNVQTILVEKPLAHTAGRLDVFSTDSSISVFVGYNLRFHPLVQALRAKLASQKILSCNLYVGQYLPTWRPERPYQESYSASREQGGGVLRDLSHELDALHMLAGEVAESCCFGGIQSSLEISAEDTACISGVTVQQVPFNIQLNYTDRIGQRLWIVVTDRDTYIVDFANQILRSGEQTEKITSSRNDSYLAMHRSAIAQETDGCALHEGIAIARWIDDLDSKIWK